MKILKKKIRLWREKNSSNVSILNALVKNEDKQIHHYIYKQSEDIIIQTTLILLYTCIMLS